MAGDDTRQFSLEEIKQMKASGQRKATPADAPEITLNDDFWANAAIVETDVPRKTSVHLRLEPETFAFFRAGGKGHLTRMAKVLNAYAMSQKR